MTVPDVAGRNPRPVTGDVTASPRRVLDGAALSRVISRMAHELLEKSAAALDRDELSCSASRPAARSLAHRLAARMREVEGREVPVGQLDITMYRDDLRLRSLRAARVHRRPG